MRSLLPIITFNVTANKFKYSSFLKSIALEQAEFWVKLSVDVTLGINPDIACLWRWEWGLRGLRWVICGIGMYLMFSHSWLTLVPQPPPPELRAASCKQKQFLIRAKLSSPDWLAGLPTFSHVSSWSHTERISEGRESWREGRGCDAVCTARLDRLETPKTDPLPLLWDTTRFASLPTS